MPEQLLILLIIGGFSLAKWVFDNWSQFSKKQEGEPPTQRSAEREFRRPTIPGRPDSEEERVRRFMEALGLPTDGSAPPPAAPAPPPPAPERPVTPMTPPPPPDRQFPSAPPSPMRRPEPTPAPPAPEARRPAPTVRKAGPTFRPVTPPATIAPAPAPPTPEAAALWAENSPALAPLSKRATFPKARPRPPAHARRSGGNELRRLLGTPSALRQAVLMREILGPPKAMQKG